MSIGEKIQKIRKANKMTQEELAQKIGVKRAVISKYENGNVNISISMLEKIATVLEVSVNELLLDGNLVFNDKIDKTIESMTSEEIKQILSNLANTLEKSKDKLYDIYADYPEILINFYDKLNHNGKKEALKRTHELTMIPEYTTPDEE